MSDQNAESHTRFANIGFADFQKMATDRSLSRYEKIGFPDSYREGFEALIFEDLRRKVPALDKPGALILDIGPGCSELPQLEIAACGRTGSELVLFDSREMLDLLPSPPHVAKIPGRFPEDSREAVDRFSGRADGVIVYSVFHYIFAEGNPFDFLDTCLSLLAPGGALLIADIPNISKRKRFFSSEAGVRCHQAYTGRQELPQVQFNALDPGCIDDAALLAMLLRARGAGFDGYIVPQAPELPMANRREDLLFVRP